MKKIVFCIFLIIFTCNLSWAQTNTNSQPLTVILDWFANPDHAPLFVAEEFGFFKKVGLTVKLIG
ncbi:MAG: ABC transporter substrate-binding protein, partial [Pseudomonadota bacterium]